MSADWKALARQAGFRVSLDDSIDVRLGESHQIVHVDAHTSDEALRLWSIIATPRTLEPITDSPLRYAWGRNRFSELVGFAVDRNRRLIGETWVPRDWLTAAELGLQIREVARVCDWHEFRLGGLDMY